MVLIILVISLFIGIKKVMTGEGRVLACLLLQSKNSEH